MAEFTCSTEASGKNVKGRGFRENRLEKNWKNEFLFTGHLSFAFPYIKYYGDP